VGLQLVEKWILVSAWCSISGWLLSAMGRLDGAGYVGTFVVGMLFLYLQWGRKPLDLRQRRRHLVPLRRFRRPLPFVYLIILLIAIIGGVLHEPNNYDGITYRFPRMLHWLAERHWHWIDTANIRMNFSGTGSEWLMVPLFLATGSDRLFFLPNIITQILLPGLIYTVFVSFGVRKHVAWWWMWLLPSGYCFALQAGSIGNDALSAVYMFAALAFAIRARARRSIWWLFLSSLAISLATGVKIINLPLVLPWLVLIAPCWKIVSEKVLPVFFGAVVALIVSFAPMAVLNWSHTGDWGGDPENSCNVKLVSPLYGIAGNVLQITAANLAPPLNPYVSKSRSIFECLKQTPLYCRLKENFPRLEMEWPEMATEESDGIGCGLLLLGCISLAGAAISRREGSTIVARGWSLGLTVSIATWAALGVYMAKIGSESAPRLIAAYYPLLLLPVLLPAGNAALTRCKWWRVFAFFAALSVLPAMVLSPSRPLWPAKTVLNELAGRKPDNRTVRRLLSIYQVYSNRADNLAPLKLYVPSDCRVVGFLGTTDDSELSLWRPFGTCRVVDITPANQSCVLHDGTVPVAVVSRRGVSEIMNQHFERWIAQNHGTVIYSRKLTVKASDGPGDWSVVSFSQKDVKPKLE
jgi:hypothetical protein